MGGSTPFWSQPRVAPSGSAVLPSLPSSRGRRLIDSLQTLLWDVYVGTTVFPLNFIHQAQKALSWLILQFSWWVNHQCLHPVNPKALHLKLSAQRYGWRVYPSGNCFYNKLLIWWFVLCFFESSAMISGATLPLHFSDAFLALWAPQGEFHRDSLCSREAGISRTGRLAPKQCAWVNSTRGWEQNM